MFVITYPGCSLNWTMLVKGSVNWYVGHIGKIRNIQEHISKWLSFKNVTNENSYSPNRLNKSLYTTG